VAVRSVQAITYAPPPSAGSGNQIGLDGKDAMDQFLKLLVSEITNQDPDKPMDSTQMVTQYAQIQAALGMNWLSQSSQAYQRVATAGTLLNQKVMVFDPQMQRNIEGKVKGIDFSGPMPLVNVDGVNYPLDQVKTLGDL